MSAKQKQVEVNVRAQVERNSLRVDEMVSGLSEAKRHLFEAAALLDQASESVPEDYRGPFHDDRDALLEVVSHLEDP